MTERPQMLGVTPHLICRDAAKAMEFYIAAFGAEPMFSLPDKQGRLMHGSMTVNGAMVMLMDEYPEHGAKSPLTIGGSAVVLHMQVPDVDASYKRAIDAGAKPLMEPADQFWGDRYGSVVDPFGHSWSLATTKQQLTPEQIMANLKQMEAPQ
jgi:PhnB protein